MCSRLCYTLWIKSKALISEQICAIKVTGIQYSLIFHNRILLLPSKECDMTKSFSSYLELSIVRKAGPPIFVFLTLTINFFHSSFIKKGGDFREYYIRSNSKGFGLCILLPVCAAHCVASPHILHIYYFWQIQCFIFI